MRKESLRIFCFIVACCLFLPVPRLAQENLEVGEAQVNKLLDDWLKSPIKHIINSEEEKAYKLKLKLKKRNEQLRFIEYFWRRRDPKPETPQNEFRMQFFSRVNHCEEYFKIGKKPGWDSQRGQIFIVLGPPSEMRKGVKTDTWTYYNLAGERIPQNFTIVFVDERGNNDYRIAETQYPGKDEGESYMEARAGRALSGSIPRDVLDAVTELNRLAVAQMDLKLEDVPLVPETPSTVAPSKPGPPVTASSPMDKAPFDLQQIFLQAEETRVRMVLAFIFRYEDMAFKEDGGKRTSSFKLQADLLDQNKNMVDSFKEQVAISLDPAELEEKKNAAFTVWRDLEADPGSYSIRINYEDEVKGKNTQMNAGVELPVLRTNELTISPIIPAEGISSLPPEPGESINTLELMNCSIKPNTAAVFQRDSNFCFFFQVLNPQADSQASRPRVDLNGYIFKDEKHFRDVPITADQFDPRYPDGLVAHACVPLTDFPPGEYVLVVQAKDQHGKKGTARKLIFSVVEKTT